ncbi:hypothetical protein BHE74_00041474 [Ensete ventricosum]|nr:hypothetical protein BHE74_00041474 [Ensete ventricosum]
MSVSATSGEKDLSGSEIRDDGTRKKEIARSGTHPREEMKGLGAKGEKRRAATRRRRRKGRAWRRSRGGIWWCHGVDDDMKTATIASNTITTANTAVATARNSRDLVISIATLSGLQK